MYLKQTRCVLQTFVTSCMHLPQPYKFVQKLTVSTSAFLHKKSDVNLKGRSKSSQEWLIRQINDPYVEKAKSENYRARSAFKLIEMDDRCCILRPGQMVVECGAAPGAWTQVITKRINAIGADKKKKKGRVCAVDVLPIYPVEGAEILLMADFTKSSTQQKILDWMEGKKADVVLSDMAPNATGVASLDHDKIIHLAYSAFRFALKASGPGAQFLVKIWDGGKVKGLREDLKKFYNVVQEIKPPSSRADSAEKFLLARDFKGLKDPEKN